MQIQIGKKYRDVMGRTYVIEAAGPDAFHPLIARRQPSGVGFAVDAQGVCHSLSGAIFKLITEV